jgi:WD40 repeat protein
MHQTMFQRYIAIAVTGLAFGIQANSSISAEELPAKVTYDDHIKPILKEHCLKCHNANEKKSGLALDSYTATMEGGAGGDAVVAGDLDSSRLWALTAHIEEPKMPPSADKIAEPKLAMIKKWIEQGMPENTGSNAMKPKVDLSQMGNVSLARPAGPLPMPETILKQTPLYTPRAAAVSALAASPWSPLIAVGGQEQVSLYHSQSGELLGVLPFPEGEPQSITFSRDGKLILVGGGQHSASGFAVLFEIKTGKRITRVGDELDIAMAADISDDNSMIALAGPEKLVRVYDTATGTKIHELKKHTDWIYALRFSPDGVLIASADRSNGLVVWEAESGKLYLDLIGHKNEIRSLAWRPDSLALASGSLDGTIKLWDMNAGKLIKSWDAHAGGVFGLASCNDGTFVSTGKDKKVKLWKSSGDPAGEMPAMPDAGLEVAVTADAKEVAAGDWEGNVKLWEKANPKNERLLRANPLTLELLVQDSEGKAAAAKKAIDDENVKYQKVVELAATAKKQLEAQEAAFAAATKGAQDAKAAIEVGKKAVEQANQTLKTHLASIDAQQKVVQDLSNQLALAKSQAKEDKELEAKTAAANKAVDDLETKSKTLRADVVAKTSQQVVLETKLANLTKGATASEQARNASKAAHAEAEKQLATAKAPVDAAVANHALLVKRVESVKASLVAFSNAKKAWSDRIGVIADQTKKAQEQIEAAKKEVETQQAMQKDVVAKIDALKKQLEEMQKSMQQVEQQRAAGEKAIADKQAAIDKQSSDVAQLQAEQASLKLQIDTYNKPIGQAAK